MNSDIPVRHGDRGGAGRLSYRFRMLLRKILSDTNQDIPRTAFLQDLCRTLAQMSGCDALELRIIERSGSSCARAVADRNGRYQVRCFNAPPGSRPGGREGDPEIIQGDLVEAFIGNRLVPAVPNRTRGGSLWISDSACPILVRDKGQASREASAIVIRSDFQSLAVCPFPVNEQASAVLIMGSLHRGFFNYADMVLYETLCAALGGAIAGQRAQRARKQEVKKMTCLEGLARNALSQDPSLSNLLPRAVRCLPPAWSYPEIARARITVDGQAYCTEGFSERCPKQSADIVVRGRKRGSVEVVYTQPVPEADEGPFFTEERSLIEEISRQLALIVAFTETRNERER